MGENMNEQTLKYIEICLTEEQQKELDAIIRKFIAEKMRELAAPPEWPYNG